MPIGILIKIINKIEEYYIFDIKEGYDDVHGDIIIVRTGIIHDNMVSELPSSWCIFFSKDTPQITNGIVSLAHSNGGRCTMSFAEFRASHVEFESKP